MNRDRYELVKKVMYEEYDRFMKKEKQTILQKLNAKGKSFWRDLKQWFANKFRSAEKKLDEIAKKLKEKIDHFGNTVSDYLSRIRRYVYNWVLRNSAIKSFEIGKEPSLLFTANKITSTGTFEFGGEFGLKNILTGLKNTLNMTLSVQVEYLKPQ